MSCEQHVAGSSEDTGQATPMRWREMPLALGLSSPGVPVPRPQVPHSLAEQLSSAYGDPTRNWYQQPTWHPLPTNLGWGGPTLHCRRH